MNPNLPKQSLGDVIDRISILSLKLHFGEEEAYKEYEYLTEAVDALNLPLTGALLAAMLRLGQTNLMIWHLENKVRQMGESMPAAEVGKRALEIRDINRKRVRYKNEINRLTGMGFREFKIQHRSQ